MGKIMFSIRKAISLVESGSTKEDLLTYFDFANEEELSSKLSTFSEKNQTTLLNLLGMEEKDERIPILDTSYIVSSDCNFDDPIWQKKFIIVRGVNEQLIAFETKGKKKITKLFYLILDRVIVPTYMKAEVTESIPYYEDPADFEILAVAEKVKNAVVYTADKRLGIRCLERGIELKFFKHNIEEKENEKTESVCPNLFVSKSGNYGIDADLEQLFVYNKSMHLQRANGFGIIPVQEGYTVLYKNQSYTIAENGRMQKCKTMQ